MIRLAENDDDLRLAVMLRDMYRELQPIEAVSDLGVYLVEVDRCLKDPAQAVFIAEEGFFMVVDETEPMTPNMKRYNGTRVYIKPEHRSGRVLKEFYDVMFRAFPDGDILGVTVLNSKHIKVLEKRHTRIANVYMLNRS